MSGQALTENTQDLIGLTLPKRWRTMWPDKDVRRSHITGLGAEEAEIRLTDNGFEKIELPREKQLLLAGGSNFVLWQRPLEKLVTEQKANKKRRPKDEDITPVNDD